MAFFLRGENASNATKPYLGTKLNRVAGRVIENPLVSVTTDALMMQMPSCRASGSNRENGVDGEVGDHSLSAKISPKVRDGSAGTGLFIDAISLNRRRWL